MESSQHTRLAALWVVPALIVAIVLGGFSVFEFTSMKPRVSLAFMAQRYEKENQQENAANAYYNLVGYGYAATSNVKRAIRQCYTTGKMEQVLELVNKHYKEQVKTDDEIKPLYENAQKYVKTQDALGQSVQDASDQAGVEKMLNQLLGMHGKGEYDEGLLYFFEYFLASQHGLDIKVCYDYIAAGVKAKPEYHWLLRYQAECQRMMGDLDGAEQSAKKAVEFDSGDFEAWHQLSIVYLLREDVNKAIEAGEKSYALKPYVENCNDLALAYVVAGKEDKYEEIAAYMKSKNETISTKIDYYRNGSVTLRQMFIQREALDA